MSSELAASRDPALTLKSTPPRAVRGFLERERLKLDRVLLGGAPVIALLAPAGFGKTAQLVQWRREALTRGALAFWFTADSRDDPMRLVQGLSHCARVACGKRGFSAEFQNWLASRADPHEAITAWLAEVAELSSEVLLVLDEVELLPTESQLQVLAYLVGNLPPNLTVALAARSSGALLASGALSPAHYTRVTANDLRLRADETNALLSAALGARCQADAAVRLQGITEGWPLGVQLAIGALARGGDPDALLGAASSDIQRYFLDAVIDRQSQDAVHLLVRLARFNLIHPNLCAELFGEPRFADELLRLSSETPLFLRAEGDPWMRLHPLAREALAVRMQALPAEDLHSLSLKACAWYAACELFEEAAEQAFLCGELTEAIAYIERTTTRMTVQGRSNLVLAWYERLTPEQVHAHPAFWMPAAWALAMGDRHAQAQPLLDRLLAQPQLSEDARFEAMLIGVTAAAFADRHDLAEQLLAPWPQQAPAAASPGTVPIHIDAQAYALVLAGRTDQARLLYAHIGRLDRNLAYSPVSYGFAALGTGLSHLWDGRSALAEGVLRPALLRAEERLGRRHPMACMTAALLAQACWELGQDDEACALLVDRLDILVQSGLPDPLLAAWRTQVRLAEHEGRQGQALALLDGLRALGQNRQMPRLQVAALADLVRVHARHGRAGMARSVCAELEALLRHPKQPVPPLFEPWMQLQLELARAQALLASEDREQLNAALQASEAATLLASGLRRHADLVQARLLRAEVLHRSGAAQAHSVLQEALSLARAEGMLWLLREHGQAQDAPPPPSPTRTELSPNREPQVRGASLLTAKEREVLGMLNGNLSNKEIAQALAVSEQTVKWHVKNLFSKLNAASRKHAVARARLMGLIDG